jgi:glycyl-tRNA synthetase
LNSHSGHKPPICVWQAGKSFRREAEQPTKHMRLKEFYQQEFQCIYTADTKNDYHTAVLEPVRKMIAQAIPFPTRIVASDRLPAYSQITMDVEVWNNDKWMEVCSISRRTDFPDKARFVTKNGTVEKDILVVEIAIGLDRCVYNYNQWAQNA